MAGRREKHNHTRVLDMGRHLHLNPGMKDPKFQDVPFGCYLSTSRGVCSYHRAAASSSGTQAHWVNITSDASTKDKTTEVPIYLDQKSLLRRS